MSRTRRPPKNLKLLNIFMMQILLTVNIMWNFRYHGSDFFFNVGEIVLNVSAPYRNTCSRLLIIPTISGDPPKINLKII